MVQRRARESLVLRAGVIGNLMMMMVMTLTAFAVVREREIGTLEQLMVTPIRRWEFILGKTVPFFLIGLADAILIATSGPSGSACRSVAA